MVRETQHHGKKTKIIFVRKMKGLRRNDGAQRTNACIKNTPVALQAGSNRKVFYREAPLAIADGEGPGMRSPKLYRLNRLYAPNNKCWNNKYKKTNNKSACIYQCKMPPLLAHFYFRYVIHFFLQVNKAIMLL